MAKEFKFILRHALEEQLKAHGEVVFVCRDVLLLRLGEAFHQFVFDRLHQRNGLIAQKRVAFHPANQRSSCILEILIELGLEIEQAIDGLLRLELVVTLVDEG